MSRIGLVIAFLALAVLPACENGEDEITTTELARRIEALPAVSSAQVKESEGVEEEEGELTWAAMVDMEDDATAEEVTAVLDVFEENDEAGDRFQGRIDRANDSIRYRNEFTNLPNADVAALLIEGATVLADDAVELDNQGSLSVLLTATGADSVTEAADQIAENENLGELDRLEVGALNPSDPDDAQYVTDARDAPYLLKVREGLSTKMREAWSDLADSLGEAANEPTALRLMPYEREEGVEIQTRLELPGNVTESELTTDEYGDELEPLIHAQLDVLADFADGSSLAMQNRSESDVDGFLSVTLGESDPGVDHEGRTWNPDAYDYLSR